MEWRNRPRHRHQELPGQFVWSHFYKFLHDRVPKRKGCPEEGISVNDTRGWNQEKGTCTMSQEMHCICAQRTVKDLHCVP